MLFIHKFVLTPKNEKGTVKYQTENMILLTLSTAMNISK